MKEVEGCPLNGKDLMGECIVDEIFDNGEFVLYPKGNNYLGLISGVPAKMGYEFGKSYIYVRPLSNNDLECADVMRAVKSFVTRFNKEESYRKAGAEFRGGCTYEVRFFYYE
jgi:hypothetical protein